MLPEFGGIELLVIGALALIIIGPKDLPVMLRKFGKFVGRMRAMAQEFRSSFDELARQSELEELRKEVEAMRAAQTYDPTGLVPGAYGPQDGVQAAPSVEPAPAYEPAPEPAAPPAPAPAARPKKAATRKPAASTKAKTSPKAKPASKPAARPAAARARKKTVT